MTTIDVVFVRFVKFGISFALYINMYSTYIRERMTITQ